MTARPAEYVDSQVVFQAAAAPERGQVAVVVSVRVAAMVHRVQVEGAQVVVPLLPAPTLWPDPATVVTVLLL